MPPQDPPGRASRTRLSSLRHSLRSRLRDDSRVTPPSVASITAGESVGSDTYSPPQQALLRGPVELKLYTSFDYGQELNDARVLASMGSVGDAYDKALVS